MRDVALSHRVQPDVSEDEQLEVYRAIVSVVRDIADPHSLIPTNLSYIQLSWTVADHDTRRPGEIYRPTLFLKFGRQGSEISWRLSFYWDDGAKILYPGKLDTAYQSQSASTKRDLPTVKADCYSDAIAHLLYGLMQLDAWLEMDRAATVVEEAKAKYRLLNAGDPVAHHIFSDVN